MEVLAMEESQQDNLAVVSILLLWHILMIDYLKKKQFIWPDHENSYNRQDPILPQYYADEPCMDKEYI